MYYFFIGLFYWLNRENSHISCWIASSFFIAPCIIFCCLGATSIEKIHKSSASGRNFLDPLPPSSKKGSTDENVGISYLIVIVKFGFFKISTPPSPISEKSRTSPILLIEVAPKLFSFIKLKAWQQVSYLLRNVRTRPTYLTTFRVNKRG